MLSLHISWTINMLYDMSIISAVMWGGKHQEEIHFSPNENTPKAIFLGIQSHN